MIRNTQQKEAVKGYLMSVCSHPTAETVYFAVRKKLPNISKGTIYRILNSFVEEGSAKEILSDVSHYDGEIKEHAHFICRKCGTVYDNFDNKMEIKYKKSNDFGQIDSYQLNFHGICKKCLK